MTLHETDVLILGAGAAGIVTALNARGRRVTVVTPDRGEGKSAASDLAQGGLAAAVGTDDSPALHLHDTVQAAREGVDIAAARRLCREGPAAIAYLESLGVRFDRDANGWSLHTEAAHSRARVLHVGDTTGEALMFGLRRALAAAAHIELLPCTHAVSLLRDTEGICGVAALTEDGRPLTIHARAVVIATGGVGGLFARSTNPVGACGDGLAMALAAGARCNALEFVQFHPTALDVDVRPLPLLTEALRGAGAKLVDENGKSVMAGVHPRAELAPRDVVARTIYIAQRQGRRVLLDATGLDCEVAEAFPAVHRLCREHGFDLRRDVRCALCAE
jgi:L-aspartate oxidase